MRGKHPDESNRSGKSDEIIWLKEVHNLHNIEIVKKHGLAGLPTGAG